jgi:NAD(P)-dependent dehydrogenase (short-subunit alcohol dehydrogenase family)
MPELSNTVAVVTGGRIGLGRALALEAARRGATVVIASPSDASSTVAEIQATGATAEWAQVDVADYAAVEALTHHVRTSHVNDSEFSPGDHVAVVTMDVADGVDR